jgi:arylsulfatase A-like enzyme
MAREGAVLSSYYAPANLCTPSRAGLLTGRYPVRTGLARAVIQAAEKRGLPRSEVTIAQALKPAGYASALFGKWHLGHLRRLLAADELRFRPLYGIPYSHDMVPLAIFDARVGVAEVKQEPVDFAYPGAFKVKPGVDDVANYTSSLEEKLYDQAAGFIEANKDRPFYLELALTTPHLPEILQGVQGPQQGRALWRYGRGDRSHRRQAARHGAAAGAGAGHAGALHLGQWAVVLGLCRAAARPQGRRGL